MYKHFKALSGVVLLVVILCISTFFVSAEGEKTGTVIGEDVNLRQEPNTSSPVLTQLSKDTSVTVYQYSDGWYQIGYESYKGWIYGWYLHVDGEALATGTIKGSVVNIRKEPNLSAEIITKLQDGDEVIIYGKSEDWYKIGFDNITGWVFGELLSVTERPSATGTVTGEGVNVRSSANIGSEVIAKLGKGTSVEVFGESGDWYKVRIPDQRMGWMHKDYVKVDDSKVSRGIVAEPAPAKELPKQEESGKSATKGQELVDFAKKLLGVKYKWGGESASGFDCSGFVKYVYGHFGISLVHNSAAMADSGKKVSKNELQIGDVLFFNTDTDKAIDHVGIYMGGGKFIHASSTKGKVVIGDISSTSYYSKYYVTARRYLK